MRTRAWIPATLLLAFAAAGATVVWPAPGSAPPSGGPARSILLDPEHGAWAVNAPDLFRVRFETSKGDFVLEVNRRWAPRGADRFYNLVRLGFYDDTRFYRVREGFIAQFGLSGDPEVNAVWYARAMPDDTVLRSNTRGMVSYAMLEAPNSRTTQLYINLDDNSRLDDQGFAPLARVVEGMAVIDSLYAGYDERAGGGMRGGNQGRIVDGGNAYLDAEFPLLDRVVTARIEPGRIMRYPDVGANRIRVEQHLLPAVTTGPLDPAWSPDGRWIAFSMRGDIWKVPAEGGTSVRLTRGPAYHFEPAWSPDGSQLALSMELDGNLDIGIVDARGGEVRRRTHDAHVDVQPTWSHDGAQVLFASARDGSFDIWAVPVERGEPTVLVSGPGHQIQPAVSPAGDRLAFVSPVRGRLGSGGLWTVALPQSPATSTEPKELLERAELVHDEQTSYRARPVWTADGAALVFVSDAADSNDLAVVPVDGGTLTRLTQDDGDEYGPTLSPDGTRIAFVSNRSGAMRLYTAPAGGARRQGWHRIPVVRMDDGSNGRVRIVVQDAATQAPMPARIFLTASDGRTYAPDGGFHKMIGATDTHYFHIKGTVEVEVPTGTLTVEAMRGYEYVPGAATIEIAAGDTRTVVLSLKRLVDAPARGWYSGETHAHDLHQGRYGLDHEGFFTQLLAEDLHATNALIHMDGTKIMGRWSDLTGEHHPLSTTEHILQYAQEFRGSFGHVGLLGISEFVMPLIGGTPGTRFDADVLNADYLDAADAAGGIGGFMHPYTQPIEEPDDGAGSEIALDVALGKGVFFDVGSIWYDELANAEMYYRYLNAGFRLAATGGSDNFADVWRDPPPGTARTYARLDGPLTMPAWLEAIRAGRTFATTGPLLFLHVNGVGPGAQIDATVDELAITLEVASITPLDRVEIIANGEVIRTFDARGSTGNLTIHASVSLPHGGWVSGRAIGPVARPLSDSYAFAQTSPVWVRHADNPYRNPADAQFLAEMVRAYWRRLDQRGRFASKAEHARIRAAVETAITRYEDIAAQARR